MTKLQDWYSFDALISVVPATLAPVMAMLASEKELNGRNISIMAVGALIGFFASLAAFRSTKFAQSKFTLTEKSQPFPEVE